MTESAAESQILSSAKQKGGFGESVLKLAGGASLAQVLGLLLAPILARLYAPEAFGALAVFSSIAAIIGIIACLRYELAIMLPERDEDAANVLALSLGLVLAVAGLSAVVILIVRDPLLRLLNAPEVAPYLWLIPLAVLANGGALALNYWNTRTKHFGRLAVVQVSAALVTNGIQLGGGTLTQGNAGGLVGAQVLGAVTATFILGRRIWRDDRLLFTRAINFRRMREMALRHRKFPLIEMWGALLNAASGEFPVLLLRVFFTQAVVGYFGLGIRVVQLPLALIGGAITQVFFQRTSEIRSSHGNLTLLTESTFRQLVTLGLFPAVLLMLFGQDLTVFVFGAKWSEAGVFIQILALFTFVRFVFSALSILFVVFERQDAAFVVHSLLFLSRLVPLMIGGWLGDSRLALGLYAGTGLVVYGAMTLWILNLAGVSTRHAIGILMRQVLYSAPVLGFLGAIKFWFDPSTFVVMALSSLALCAHLAVIILTDSTLRELVFSIVHMFKRGQGV